MSRKLGVIALAMAILVCAMGLKTVLAGSGSRSGAAVLTANGPDPVPTKNPWPKKTTFMNGPDPVPTKNPWPKKTSFTNGPDPVPTKNPWPKKTLIANGPDPVPTKNPWPKKTAVVMTSVPEVR